MARSTVNKGPSILKIAEIISESTVFDYVYNDHASLVLYEKLQMRGSWVICIRSSRRMIGNL